MDPKRCKDIRFLVDPAVHHTQILFSCLNLMEGKLKRDICGLDDHGDLSGVSDLSICRKEHIGAALEYACQFWTKHLVQSPSSGPDSGKVQQAIEKFFTKHLLFWIEVLIVMENLDTCIHSINDIRQWYILVSSRCSMFHVYSPLVQGGNVCKWADDSQQFILEHFDTIHKSPSLIYHSALPLSPSSSWLHIYYAPELSQAPTVVRGAKAEWGACFRTVSLDDGGLTLSYWNNTIAVGSRSGNIIMLSTITGSQIAVLSEHTDWTRSVVFSSDGRSLVSGSDDKTVKLWDMQTGGVVKTFYGHTNWVCSVSVSVDCIRVASGSVDATCRLWDTQTGECFCTIQQQTIVHCVGFTPLNPQHIFSISGGKIWEWDIDGHQIPSTYDGSCLTFSPDCAQFVLCNGFDVTVQNTSSRITVTKLQVADGTQHYCFSPDGRLIATAVEGTAYVWDITSQDPYLIETFVDHTYNIASLVFPTPSTLVSTSMDKSIKFWKIGALSTDCIATNAQYTPLSSAYIQSISLQARDGIAISSDSAGVVKIWDILTGACKASFYTPAGRSRAWTNRDARLINNRLIFAWYEGYKIHIWETEKGELLQTIDTTPPNCLRISGDGSKIICLFNGIIRAWYMWTWGLACEVKLDLGGTLYLDSLCTYSPRIWIHSMGLPAQEGWDFGNSGSTPVPFDPSTGRPYLDFIGGTKMQVNNPSWVKNTVTGRRVFQLSGEYARPNDIQWDGQFLVAGYHFGEVLVLDFHHILS